MDRRISPRHGIAATGAALLAVVGLMAAFAGSAVAAPVAPAMSSTTAWAYGNMNSTSGTRTFTSGLGPTTESWNYTIGEAVIFNATPNGPNTTELEVDRTVGVSVALSLSAPKLSVAFDLKAVEVDRAYANVTNASRVYVDGTLTTVPALGLDNTSFAGRATLNESLTASNDSNSASAYLNASASASAQVGFTPSLGLVPLNLSGVSTWNSSAYATPSASWSVAYAYDFHGWNGSTGSGHHIGGGNWSAAGTLSLHGAVVSLGLPHAWRHARGSAILLEIVGPASLYDGFVVVPHGFDPFGGAAQPYARESMATVSFGGGELLWVNAGRVHVDSLAATDLVMAGGAGAEPALVSGSGLPSASPMPSEASVVTHPESVSTAQGQSHCLQFGCPSGASGLGPLGEAVLIGALVAAVVGTVGVVEWRSYARRKTRATELVGGYGEGMSVGVPPAAGTPLPAPPTPSAGSRPPAGPGAQP